MPGSRRKSVTKAEEVVEETPQPDAPPIVENHDETDVEAALARDTQDGKGDDPVPPSDFESFATTDVHPEVKSVDVLAEEVLKGQWGEYVGLRDRLDDAGHIATEVLKRVNDRLARGAPSAYRASLDEVVNQIDHGEWGDNPRALESRLLGAGFRAADVAEILRTVRRS